MAKIISVHSYRGGTGKSNLTGNIAASIATHGKRVAIVDTDIQSPGIHVLFGMDEESISYTLNDYLWSHCAIRDVVCDVSTHLRTSALGQHFSQSPTKSSTVTESTARTLTIPVKDADQRGNLYLIPASVRTQDITRIVREGYDPDVLNEGFHTLIEELSLDYLFIDTHPGINADTLLSIAISHILVLIMRPDYQDYQGTAVTVDLAQQLEVPQMFLVVNKALPIFNLEDLRQQVEDAYNVSVIGVLPLSEEVAHLASSDIFSQRYPEHPWSDEVNTIARRLMLC
ncbi:MAG: MinD/ParA family protein [Scytonema sp. RU_4_4]|nr:MinD/ParA family protein [Scytonema sp. RU_4_4]NJR74639.1 MinD/ParA family protein [Scytonema sp. CRU_2_7]